MTYDDKLKDKNLDWYNDFERKAYSMVYQLQSERKIKEIVSIAKTYLKVRRAKIKKFGKDHIPMKKIFQLQSVVKTYGLFTKPMSIEKIISYDGVIFSDEDLGIISKIKEEVKK